MDRKLAGIRDQARTMHQEAGVNTLYLALGFLEWREAQQSEKKHFSPLLLLPASLEYRRGQPWGHYLLFSDQADVETNKTLEMRLERDFGFEMPHFEANDTPETFLQKVIEATDDQPNWSVRRFLTVGNFGFSKLTMFNDLAVENWPTEHSLSSLPLEHFLIGRNRRGFPSMVICDSRCGLVKEAGLHDETSFQRHSRTACICG
jgi:hypothetical protein